MDSTGSFHIQYSDCTGDEEHKSWKIMDPSLLVSFPDASQIFNLKVMIKLKSPKSPINSHWIVISAIRNQKDW